MYFEFQTTQNGMVQKCFSFWSNLDCNFQSWIIHRKRHISVTFNFWSKTIVIEITISPVRIKMQSKTAVIQKLLANSNNLTNSYAYHLFSLLRKLITLVEIRRSSFLRWNITIYYTEIHNIFFCIRSYLLVKQIDKKSRK